jgi:O-antigen ligase
MQDFDRHALRLEPTIKMLRRNARIEKVYSSPGEEPQLAFTKRSAKLLGQIIFVGLLAVIVFTAIPYGTVDAWFETVFECAVFALTTIWISEVLLRGSWQVNKTLILLPMMLLTAYAFLQTVQLPGKFFVPSNGSPIAQTSLTIDQYQTHLTAVKMLALTLFTALLLLHVSSRKRLQWLVHIVIALGLGSALFAIGRQLLQSPDSTTGFALPFLYPGIGYGQFLSSNVFAFLAEMAFALVMGVVLGGGVRRQHIPIYLAISLIIWAALVLSNSRGGILGFICQAVMLAVVGLSWFRSRRLAGETGREQRTIPWFLPIRILVILVMVVTLVVGVLWMGGERLASKLDKDVANATTDGVTRKEIWQSTWQLIKHNPWTGVGFGAYFLAIPQYQSGSGRTKIEQAHNDYLDLAASGGVLAIILAAWFLGVIIWRARSSLRSADAFRRAAGLGAAAGLLSVSVHSLVDFGLQVTGIAVVALTLVVILVAEIAADPKHN